MADTKHARLSNGQRRSYLVCGWLPDRAICFRLQLFSFVGNRAYLAQVLFVRSVIQVVLGRPRHLLPSVFPSFSGRSDVLSHVRCPIYCNFLVWNAAIFLCLSHPSQYFLVRNLCHPTYCQNIHIWAAFTVDNSDFAHGSSRTLVSAGHNNLLLSI